MKWIFFPVSGCGGSGAVNKIIYRPNIADYHGNTTNISQSVSWLQNFANIIQSVCKGIALPTLKMTVMGYFVALGLVTVRIAINNE